MINGHRVFAHPGANNNEKGISMEATDCSKVATWTSVNDLMMLCHGAALRAGWWVDPISGVRAIDNPMCFSQKLMLIVSELAEAMEGDRKNLMDDKLPHRPMREVELADALIRIFDTAGAFGMDLGGALVEKMAYNAIRADHKPENRARVGGKSY